MQKTNWFTEIKKKDFDLDQFVNWIFEDIEMREEMVDQMLTNEQIMVYYHCFYVIEKASEIQPKAFSAYWESFITLLDHENSYHRDFGLILIANLISVEAKNKFDKIKEKYFSLINDPKFMTGHCCLKNMGQVLKSRPDLWNEISRMILNLEVHCTYSEKQIAVMKADVLDIIAEWINAGNVLAPELAEFIQIQVHSISPKSRKAAKALAKTFNL